MIIQNKFECKATLADGSTFEPIQGDDGAFTLVVGANGTAVKMTIAKNEIFDLSEFFKQISLMKRFEKS